MGRKWPGGAEGWLWEPGGSSALPFPWVRAEQGTAPHSTRNGAARDGRASPPSWGTDPGLLLLVPWAAGGGMGGHVLGRPLSLSPRLSSPRLLLAGFVPVRCRWHCAIANALEMFAWGGKVLSQVQPPPPGRGAAPHAAWSRGGRKKPPAEGFGEEHPLRVGL